MRWRFFPIFALSLAVLAAPQTGTDAYARDYVRFLVVQLDQWSNEFPQQFYQALVRPPLDASKVSEIAKAGPGELGDAIRRLTTLSAANDLLTNAGFRSQVERTLNIAKEVNQALSTQRFPALLQSDWDQIRSTLNNLGRVYKLETLAVLEPPAAARAGRTATASAKTPVAPGSGVAGYIVDLSCAKRGKGMWTNAECVARCVRDGDKLVLVTEEGKVFQIANPDKLTPENYGQVVTLVGKTAGETITVESVRI